jgi:YVTN family beta-propeller protein
MPPKVNARIVMALSIIVVALTSQWVSPVDSASVVAVIPVPSTPASIAVNAETNRIYIGHEIGAGVSVIDGSTNSVIANVSGLGCCLLGIAANPVTNRVYVAASSSIYVIDGISNSVVTQIPVGPAGTTLHNVAVNPETNRIYVTERAQNRLLVVDGETNTIVATIPMFFQPRAVAVNPTTNHIYVTNSDSQRVSVVDGATDTVIRVIPIAGVPSSVAIDTNRGFAYIGNNVSDTLSIINDLDGTLVNTVPLSAGGQHDVTVDESTKRVYVTTNTSVNVLDGVNGSLIENLPMFGGIGTFGEGIAADSIRNRIYVPERFTSSVTVVQGDPPDTTPPTTTVEITGTNGNNGWYTSEVTISLTATDNSGGRGPKEIVYSANGAQTISTTTVTGSIVSFQVTAEGQTSISYYARDNVGNVELAQTLTLKLDKSLPTISISQPVEGGNSVFSQSVIADYMCADGISGISSCIGSVPIGNSVDTQSVGSKNFVVQASDNAGHSTAASVSYTVSKASSSIKLTSFVSADGRSVTFTATVNVVFPGTATPTGEVQFLDNKTLLGTVVLINGSASITVPVKSYKITALYGGTPEFIGVTSPTLHFTPGR